MVESQTKLASGAMARLTVQTELLDRPDVGGPELERFGSLSLGSRVRVVDVIGDWVQVEIMGIRGYVRRDAVEPA